MLNQMVVKRGSVSSAGVRRKRERLWCERESTDPQDYEQCQLHDMDVEMDENKEGVELHSQCGEQFGWLA